MKVKCPVCKKQMFSPHKNTTYECETKEEYVPSLKTKLEYTHAIVYLDDKDHAAIKRITVMPYCFEIIDQGDFKQTRIIKVTNPAHRKRPAKNEPYKRIPRAKYGDVNMEAETIIVVPNAINADWTDKTAVEDRVKMYMLFS